MNYFPGNKISHYIKRLPSALELHGDWEVTLTEFIYPHTWNNVNSENNLIGFDVVTGKELGKILPPGFYATVPENLKAITLKEHQNKLYLSFNSATKRVSINVQDRARLILHDGLEQMLGFEPMQIYSAEENVDITVESSHVSDPCALYHVLFVYTDIVESQVVGDILAPLLRIVNVEGNDGEMVNAQYDRPHY